MCYTDGSLRLKAIFVFMFCLFIFFVLNKWIGMTLSEEEGAATTLHVATHPQVNKVDGSYFDACLPVTPSSKATWVSDWFYSEINFSPPHYNAS